MEKPPGEGPGLSSLVLCLWAHLIHHFPCQHCSMVPTAINGLAFKSLSYLASSCVFSLGFYQCSSLHQECTPRPHPHFLAFCSSINSMSPPLRSLPNSCQEKKSHFCARTTEDDPRGPLLASVSYSMKYVRQGPSPLRTE